MKIHPRPARFRELLARWAEVCDQDLLGHLVSCEVCLRSLRVELDRPSSGPSSGPSAVVIPWPGSQGAARLDLRVARAEAATAPERATAQGCLEALLAAPPGERNRLVDRDPRCRSWWVADGLLDHAADRAGTNPAEVHELLELAARVLALLEPADSSAELVADLDGRRQVLRGDLLRRQGHLEAAADTLAAARRRLVEGTGDPIERSFWLDRSARLRWAVGRPGDAAHLAGRAAEVALSVGESLRAAHARRLQSAALRGAGRPARAAAVLERAVTEIPEAEHAEVRLELLDLLADAYLASGRLRDARRATEGSRTLYRQRTSPESERRRLALVGRIHLALGQLAEAEPLLAGAWRGYVANGPGVEAALLAVERARLVLRRGGRPEEAAALGDALAVYESRFVGPEARLYSELLERLRRPGDLDEGAETLDELAESCNRALFTVDRWDREPGRSERSP